MLRFRDHHIEKRLEERKNQLTPHTYQYIRKVIDQGAEGIGPYKLSSLCNDLDCLPTDIIEYV